MNKKIILASASPRRRELLTQIGLDFDVVVSETEEKINSTEPAEVVEELSAQKAEAAAAMLTMLQGRGHEVYTGVTILYEENGERKTLTFHEKTTVHFYPMTDAQIREYVATGDPMDKAGAYGIQGFCARYIRGIEGDYNNVVGLPVGRVYQELHGLRLV